MSVYLGDLIRDHAQYSSEENIKYLLDDDWANSQDIPIVFEVNGMIVDTYTWEHGGFRIILKPETAGG